jgi:Baseplate J-like protein
MSEFCNVGPAERFARLQKAYGSTYNAIEYIDVLDQQMPGGVARQKTLVLVCIKSIAGDNFHRGNIQITGGVRVRDVGVVWVHIGTDFLGSMLPGIDDSEFSALKGVITNRFGTRLDSILVVRTGVAGDSSGYSLSIVQDVDASRPPDSFDPMLSSVSFSFAIECSHDFDCGLPRACPVEERQTPTLDYLAKDYDSFRALMLDRLSVTVPDWNERNPADVGMTLVELLAYAGDQLSYYQDVVANEAYLGTSRLRTSVRRHARLLDYRLREGSNARTWVRVASQGGDVQTVPAKTKLLSRRSSLGDAGLVSSARAQQEIDAGATVFETMEDMVLRYRQNTISFHLWGASSMVLRKGTTCATLRNTDDNLHDLKPGDVIALVELRSFNPPYLVEDADPTKRHVVRLTKVTAGEDPLFFEHDDNQKPKQRLLHVEWDGADALPFDLCVAEFQEVVAGKTVTSATSVAWGNIVLADHGCTVSESSLTAVSKGSHRELPLQKGPLTFQGQVGSATGKPQPFDRSAPARALFTWDFCVPSISLNDGASTWEARYDLLGSREFDHHFVVETEDDGTARVRFGDGVCGELPLGPLDAHYRIGNGVAGNVGQDILVHLVSDQLVGIDQVQNVIPAQGGSDPETIEHAILLAPHAYRTQERAVTEADYAAVAERHPEVQRAVATRKFLGSWDVFFIAVDRADGKLVDAAFKQEIRQFIENFRLAGHDLEIEAPRFVPLDIVLPICVLPGHLRSQVLAQLEDAFSAVDVQGKPRGFFHPDNFTFGQPVYLSQMVALAMSIPGVQAVLTDPDSTEFHFRRYLSPDGTPEQTGILDVKRSEIATVANDLNQPMGGKIEFRLRGGL